MKRKVVFSMGVCATLLIGTPVLAQSFNDGASGPGFGIDQGGGMPPGGPGSGPGSNGGPGPGFGPGGSQSGQGGGPMGGPMGGAGFRRMGGAGMGQGSNGGAWQGMGPRGGGRFGGGDFAARRQKMIERFDANHDGQLSEDEKAKMQQFIHERRQQRMERMNGQGFGGGPAGLAGPNGGPGPQ